MVMELVDRVIHLMMIEINTVSLGLDKIKVKDALAMEGMLPKAVIVGMGIKSQQN